MVWQRRARLIAAMTLAVWGVGCGSSVKLTSRPHSAEVIMDGERVVGETPILLKEQTWIWTKHTLTFRKAGYVSEQRTLEASGGAANVIVCLCLWPLWPLALQGNYPESIVVELVPARQAALKAPGEGVGIAFSAD